MVTTWAMKTAAEAVITIEQPSVPGQYDVVFYKA